MFKSNKEKNKSERSKGLALYRNENLSLLVHLKKIQTYIEKLQTLDEHEKSKVLGYFTSFQMMPSGTTNSRQNQLDLFDNLQYEVDTIKRLLGDLIKSLEEENQVLSQHLSNLRPNSVEVDNEISRLLIKYNEEQSYNWAELSRYLPNMMEVEQKIIGVAEQGIEENIKIFHKKYGELEETIKSNPKPEEVVRGLITLIFFLHKYLEAQENHTKEAKDDFLTAIESKHGKGNAYKFAKNFFSFSKGSELTYSAKQIHDKIQGTAYSQLDDETKEEVNSFLSDTLEKLTKGLSKAVKTKADSICKSEKDYSEEEKAYNALILQLIDKIRKEGKYLATGNKPISSLKKFLVELHSTGMLTFEEFDKKIKDKNNSGKDKVKLLEEMNHLLHALLDSSKNNNYYTSFMDYQVNQPGVGVIKTDKNGNGESEKEIFKEGEKYDGSGNIKDFIEEALANTLGPNGVEGVETLLQQINEEYVDEQTITPFKNYIVHHLSTIGTNLGKYKEEGHISPGNYDSASQMLKTLISRLKTKVTNVKDIQQILDITKQVCNLIRNG